MSDLPIQLIHNSHKKERLLLDLPPELMLLVVQLLSAEDQQTFSLLSRSSREFAWPSRLKKLVYTRGLAYQIRNINQLNVDAKAAIREIFLVERPGSDPLAAKPILFQFLESLPNLQSFRWFRDSNLGGVPDPLRQLVASLKHCNLEHFEYWMPNGEVPCGPVTAPSGLKSIIGKFHYSHLYDIIQPSFSTLVELQIRTYFPDSHGHYFSRVADLLPLIPVGRTLKKFFYKAYSFHPSILDTIPDAFPNLTCLQLTVDSGRPTQWEKSYDDAISRNANLEFLFVEAAAFVFCDANCHIDYCSGCEDRRLNATCSLAKCCTGLRRCVWGNTFVRYAFVVKVGDSADGHTLQVEREPLPQSNSVYARWSTLVFPGLMEVKKIVYSGSM